MNTFLSKSLFLALGLLLNSLVIAQSYNFTNYTNDDGLASNEVYCSFQDEDGSMLFGTDAGLVRFNGNSFKTVPFTQRQKTNSVIFNFFKSSNGRLYISTYRNGLFYLDGDSVRPYLFNQKLLQLSGESYIANFSYTENNSLFFGLMNAFDYRVYQIDNEGNETVFQSSEWYNDSSNRHGKYLFIINDTLSISKSTGIHVDKNFNPTRNPQIFDTEHKSNDNLETDNSKFHFLNLPESKFKYDLRDGQQEHSIFHNKTWWVSYNSMLAIFDTAYNLIAHCELPDKINHLSAANNGSIIVSHFKGASLVTWKNSFFKIKPIIKNELITSSYIDREEGVWLTSTKNGIYYTPSLKVFIHPLLVNQDILVIKTNPFEFAISNREGTLSLYSFPDLQLRYSIANLKQYYSFLLNEGYIQANSLQVFFDSNHTIETKSFHMLGAYDIYQYPNSNSILLATTSHGIHPAKIGFKTSHEDLRKFDTELKTYAVHILDSIIYVGTDNGIKILSLNTVHYSPYLANAINIRIRDLHSIGHTLIATSSEGIFICKNNTVIHLTTKDGLVSNVCKKIEVQNDSTFWVSTKSGLNQIIYNADSHQYQIYTFTMDDGLNSNSINDLSLEGEHLFIASNKGLCYTKIEDLKINKSSIPFEVSIPSLKISDFNFTDTLFLPEKKRDIYLLIEETSFRHNENLSFSYVLNKDDDNRVISSNNSISYANLKPGYNSITLNIASANNVWNSKPITLHIWATPYFYEQLWFKASSISLLLLIGGISLLFVFKVREKRQKQRLDIAIARQEATISQYNALSLQLNPHFIFNSLNNIQYLSVSKNYVAVNQFVANLAKLTRNILEHSKLQLIPLETEIDNLRLFLDIEAIRFEHKPITIDFSIDTELDLQHLLIPPMIVQPSVENAIWHGLLNKEGERLLKIHFLLLENGFKVEITDNGIGLNTKQKGEIKIKGKTSVGVKNTRERIQLYNSMNLGNANFSLAEQRNNANEILGTVATFTFMPYKKVVLR